MKIQFVSLLASCALLTLTGKVHSQTNLEKPLSKFTLESDNDYWLNQGETKTVNLVSYFKAASNVNEEHKRFPLNLSIVIDQSGSMKGEKIERTIEAVNHLLKQLEPEDMVSVVTYESNVKVVIEPQKVKDKNSLLKKIEKIEANGSTFLSGGMEKGYSLIKSVKDTLQDPSYVHRVILLSDGRANEGIIDPQSLGRIASNNLQNHNISISTIGVGGDYNESLMSALAIQGTGNYYFVGVAEDIPGIFDEELDGVQSLVSKETVLILTFPENSLKLRQVHHYNYTLSGGEITIELNDVFSANEKAFLVEFDVVDGYHGTLDFSAQLTYLNALDELKPVDDRLEFSIKETDSDQDFKRSFRQIGSLTHLYMLSAESFELATMASEEGDFNEAESLLETAMGAIKTYNSRFKSHPFLEDINDAIKEYKKVLKDLQKKPKRNRNFTNRSHRYYTYRTISCPSF